MDNEGAPARAGSVPPPDPARPDGADAWGLLLALIRFVVTLPAAAVFERLEGAVCGGEWHLAWRRNGAWLGLYVSGVVAWARVDPATVKGQVVIVNDPDCAADLLRLTRAAGGRAASLRALRAHVDGAGRAGCALVRVRAGGAAVTVPAVELAAAVAAAEALGEPDGDVLVRAEEVGAEGATVRCLLLDGGQWVFAVDEVEDEDDNDAEGPPWAVELGGEAEVARPGPAPTFPRERWVALRERAGVV